MTILFKPIYVKLLFSEFDKIIYTYKILKITVLNLMYILKLVSVFRDLILDTIF